MFRKTKVLNSPLKKRLWSFFFQDKLLIFRLVVIIILASLTNAYLTFGDYLLINAFLNSYQTSLLIIFFLLLILSGFLHFLLFTYQNYLLELNTAISTYHLEVALFKRINELDIKSFKSVNKEVWLNLFTTDVPKIAASFKEQLNFIYSINFIIFSIIFLAIINPLTLFLILLATIITGLTFLYSAYFSNQQEQIISNHQENYLRHLVNLLKTFPVALLLDKLDYYQAKFTSILKKRKKRVLFSKVKALSHYQVYSLTYFLGNALIIFGIVYFWSKSLIPFALLLTANQKLERVKANFTKILDTYKAFNLVKVFENRWGGLFSEKKNSSDLVIPVFKELSLKKISLRLDQKGNFIFKNLSFSLKRGEKLLITGRSGIGKSLLLALITNKLLPSKGQIIYNRRVLKDSDSVTNFVNLLPPLTPLLKEKFKELLDGFGYLNVNKQRLKELITILKLDFLSKEQIDGEELIDPEQLSNGQQKRLAIAQMLFQPAQLTIFDEPLSSLDEVNRDRVFEVIFNETETLIMVSHHLKENLKQRFTKILELDEGASFRIRKPNLKISKV